MALYNLFGKIKVKSYSIDQKDILGQGAFGIVFKGNDVNYVTIAAKRIDGNLHPRILTQDLERLKKLDHPNVMKILDVEREKNIVWIMMPYCGMGDLNNYYSARDVSDVKNLEIMRQIMSGINYLHSKDIVHMDVKTGNIIVTSQWPFAIQLTDFDLFKCLDPVDESFLMTLAFKAPEFFQRTSPGKIEYHRNVDIYAAGLTFLAILQAQKGKKMLIPHIETPMDDSELHVPSIGQLIAERIKYKVPELRIVKVEGEHRGLKWLISQMTSVNPQERLSAAEVLYVLNNIETVEADLGQEIQKIKLGCTVSFNLPGLLTADVNKEGQILARTAVDDRFCIKVIDRFGREVSRTITSVCDHSFSCLITQSGFVFEGCSICEVIRKYNKNTGQYTDAHREIRPLQMCLGPTGSILVLGLTPGYRWWVFPTNRMETCVFELKLNKGKRVLRADKMLQICYKESFDALVVIFENKEIEAMKLGSNIPIWKLCGVMDGRLIKPDALATDAEGNVYVSDAANNRILKINGLTGELLTTLLLGEEDKGKEIHSLFWSDSGPCLTVVRQDRINTFLIPNA